MLLKHLSNSIEYIGKRLLSDNETLSVAESCTGGLIGGAITSISGSSSWFNGGIISYSNSVKEKLLNVNGQDLFNLGAVSETVAKQMAFGVAKATNSNWSIAVTGIAGPLGGTVDKPVGLVYIAVFGKIPEVKQYNFSGSREDIRNKTVDSAILLLKECIDNSNG